MSIRSVSAPSSRKRAAVTLLASLLVVALGTFAVADAQRPDGESTLASLWRSLISEPAREAAPPWAQRLMDFIASPRFVGARNPAPAPAASEPESVEVVRRERPIPVAPIDREDVYAVQAEGPAPEAQLEPVAATRARPAVDAADPYGMETASVTPAAPTAPAAIPARPRLVSAIEADNPYL